MAASPPVLTWVAGYDEAALEALANRGLLRRARKELDSAPPECVSATHDSCQIQLGSWIVQLDQRGPAQAHCSCPALGMCQHILAACLWLREQAPAAEAEQATATAEPAPEQEALHQVMLGFSHAQLQRWAGKAALRWALHLLQQAPTWEIQRHPQPLVRCQYPVFQLRCLGPELEHLLLEPDSGDKGRRQIVAAVLAYQHAHGLALPELDDQPSSQQAQAAAEAPALLHAAQRLLLESLELGLAHPSAMQVQRYLALALSLEGLDYHRLGLALRRLAGLNEARVQRRAEADYSWLLAELARCYALIQALQAAAPALPQALAGIGRRQYQVLPRLQVQGLGAYPWRTASGFAGLSVLLWAPSLKRYLNFTRLCNPRLGEDDPLALYQQALPWASAGSFAQLAAAHATLSQAKLSHDGRLSGSSKTQALLQAPAAAVLESLVERDWTRLVATLNHQRAQGLAEADPQAGYCVIQPSAWGKAQFDPTLQVLTLPIYDAQQAELWLHLPYRPWLQLALKRLEQLQPVEGLRLVGRWQTQGQIFPIALLWPDGRVDSLSLALNTPLSEPSASPAPAAASVDTEEDDDGELLSSEETLEEEQPLPLWLQQLRAELQRYAEAGLSGRWPAPLQAQLEQLASAGLELPRQLANPQLAAEERLLRLYWGVLLLG